MPFPPSDNTRFRPAASTASEAEKFKRADWLAPGVRGAFNTYDKPFVSRFVLCHIFGKAAIWLVLTLPLATLSMAVAQELPAGEGKKLLEERCASCHSLKPVVGLKQSQSAWKTGRQDGGIWCSVGR
jgi:hypothetical protein